VVKSKVICKVVSNMFILLNGSKAVKILY